MKDVVILAHGTGDADLAGDEAKWWQAGSMFATELISAFEARGVLAIAEPFVWDGRNSEESRRKAGRRLAKRLFDLEAAGQRYHLVGHSHGGSIIEEALLAIAARRNAKLQQLQSITTVGTPFIEMKPKRLSLRTMISGMIAPYWLLPFLALLSVACVQVAHRSPDSEVVFTSYATVFIGFMPGVLYQALGVLFALVILMGVPRTLILVFMGRKRWSKRQLSTLLTLTASRRQHLWHPQDEAIAGLRAARHAHVSIFQGSRISSLFRAIIPPLFFLGAISFFVSGATSIPALVPVAAGIVSAIARPASGHFFSRLSGSALNMVMISTDWFSHAIKMSSGNINREWSIGLVNAASSLGVLSLVAVAILALLYVVARFVLDYPYQWFVVRLLDDTIANRVRINAFGADVSSETIFAIGHVPAYLKQDHFPLPASLAEEILFDVNQHATDTIAKVRRLLGTAILSAEGKDVIGELAGQFSWRELVHCSYFHNRTFVQLLAYGALVLCGEVSPAEEPSHDLSQIGRLYAEMSEPPSQRQN